MSAESEGRDAGCDEEASACGHVGPSGDAEAGRDGGTSGDAEIGRDGGTSEDAEIGGGRGTGWSGGTQASTRPVALRFIVAGWTYLRAVSGDDAYERYLAHHAAEHPGQAPMNRKDYFNERQRQKWTGVTRCC